MTTRHDLNKLGLAIAEERKDITDEEKRKSIYGKSRQDDGAVSG